MDHDRIFFKILFTKFEYEILPKKLSLVRSPFYVFIVRFMKINLITLFFHCLSFTLLYKTT